MMARKANDVEGQRTKHKGRRTKDKAQTTKNKGQRTNDEGQSSRAILKITKMKKWLYRIGSSVLILIAALLLIAAWTETDTAVLTKYKQNDELSTIKPGWPGTPVDQNDRFIND